MAARTLDVYLYTHFVGELRQDEHGFLSFRYLDSWLDSANAVPLSCSLPLRTEGFPAKECRAFFAGVLPEESNRKLIARNLGISAQNDFAMLEQIGGECAGAITFLSHGQSLPKRDSSYRELTNRELIEILQTLPRRPLLAGEHGVRLSLAGAQDKVAVRVVGDKISIPLGNAPSTHILKPAIERFEGTVFNEALCMRLAQATGLSTAGVEIRSAGGIDYLLIERYDRSIHDGKLTRLHQEDFCQALGVAPELKYQNEGGPSVKQCFDLLREISSSPVLDLQALLNSVIFNFLVGNHDAHGKNFSMIYAPSAPLSARLSPLYDVLCTVYYPELSPKMAMKIGGEYASDKVRPKHFEKLATEANLSKPMVRERVLDLAQTIVQKLPSVALDHPTAVGVATLIKARCERVIRQFRPQK